MMYADLHVHSLYSDGTDTPARLAAIAKERGVKAMVLTDHDTIAGWEEIARAAGEAGIETMPGVEITTSVNRVNVHVLGYGFDPGDSALRAYLTRMCRARREHTRVVLEGLNELGVLAYPWKRAEARLGGREWVCSFDIYDAMAADGMPPDMDKNTFYARYFSAKGPAYRGIEGFSAEGAIDVIQAAGGVPVIAHPKLVGDDGRIRELLEYGAKGLGANYPAHDAMDRARYTAMAREYGAFAAGGTDWHGDNSQWGARIGEYGVDEDTWRAIRSKARYRGV